MPNSFFDPSQLEQLPFFPGAMRMMQAPQGSQAPQVPQIPQGPQGPQGPGPGTSAKPPLLDRILARLFPTNPAYAAMMTPEQRRHLPREGLSRFGWALAKAGGPQPTGTSNVLSRIVDALGSVQNGDWQRQEAEATVQGTQYAKQQQQEQARNGILNRYPAAPDETVAQTGARYLRMLPEFIRNQDWEIVGRMTELLKSMQLGGTTPQVPQGTPHNGENPATHEPEQFLVDANGKVTWLGIPPAPTVSDPDAKAAIALQREATRGQPLVNEYRQETKDLTTALWFGTQGLQQADLAVNSNDAGAQYALFHAFLKLNDPAAVVRAGTAQLVQEATSMYQRVEKAIQGINQGQLMPHSFALQVARVTAEQVQDLQNRLRHIYTETSRRAEHLQLDPSVWVPTPMWAPDEIITPWIRKRTTAPAPGSTRMEQRLPPRPR